MSSDSVIGSAQRTHSVRLFRSAKYGYYFISLDFINLVKILVKFGFCRLSDKCATAGSPG